jgi:outer membrane protein OmpA-like peptidoglycan-associated protein
LAVQFVVDESTGGDVLLVNRNVERLSLLSRVDTCVALDGASDAFRRFAFDALPGILSPAKSAASLSFQGNCLEQIRQDKVQLAALRNPHAALARSEGQRVLFTSWQVGAHLNFDVAVSRRDLDPLQRRAIRALAGAYFASVTHWRTEPENAARTLQNDCATLCEKDPSLGGQFLADMKLFNLQDNGCVWFGACREGGSLREAVQELSALFAHDKQQGGPELRFPLEELFDASTLLNLAREAGMDFGATKAALGLAPGASGATPGAAELDVQTPSVAVLHYKVLHEVPRLAKTAVDVDAESTVKLPKLEFAAGSFQLDFAAQTQLKQWSRVLWRFPGVCFRVIGYSTFKEEPEPDFRLSRVRAQAVASELTRLRPDAFPETRFELVAKRAAVGVVNARSVEMGVLPCKVW